MVKVRMVPGVPKWIQEEPSKGKKKLIKEKVYGYLENLVLTKGPLGKTKELIPGFIPLLGQHDSDFKEMNLEHIKTTYKVIEAIYNELKNNARKIEKEIKAGRVIPYAPPDVAEVPQPKDENEAAQKAPPQPADGGIV